MNSTTCKLAVIENSRFLLFLHFWGLQHPQRERSTLFYVLCISQILMNQIMTLSLLSTMIYIQFLLLTSTLREGTNFVSLFIHQQHLAECYIYYGTQNVFCK